MRAATVLRMAALLLALVAATGLVLAAEEPKKEGDAPKKAEEPTKAAKGDEKLAENVVAKVDDVLITRDDLNLVRRQIAMNPQVIIPNNERLVDMLIERVLWQRYFQREGLTATGAELQRAIQQIDAELRQRGASYQRLIASRGLTAEEHAGMLAFEISTRRLGERIARDVKEDEIKREFDAHPEWYDGSRILLAQIFIETADVAHDPEKVKKAKERIDKLYAELEAGKDFDTLAKDYSEGAASFRGGLQGWFTRKPTSDEDEPLMSVAWNLKVGQYTKPLQSGRGWHILKVVDREPARFTFFGAKPGVLQELVRKRLNAILDELKAKAKIEKRI